jgi:bifunctional non-homologous end joining protein LigD
VRGRPEWLPTQPIRVGGGELRSFCLVNDLSSLAWVVNLNTIELHPLLAYAERLDDPAAVVFDLDPGPGADVFDCCDVALRLRIRLAAEGFTSFVKTSGSVGLHVYVPLNTAHTYADTKSFARRVADALAAELPNFVTAELKKAARTAKVLVDWRQNESSRSLAAPYSLRAMPWPSVSTPVAWEEVEEAAATRRQEVLTFDAHDVLARLDRFGDLFRPVVEVRQTLRASR